LLKLTLFNVLYTALSQLVGKLFFFRITNLAINNRPGS